MDYRPWGMGSRRSISPDSYINIEETHSLIRLISTAIEGKGTVMGVEKGQDIFENGSSAEDDGIVRTGTTKTCVAHIITSVIGSGVLSLAWGTAQLGWIGGPVSMVFFAFVTYASAFLLSDCYRSPDSVTGARNKSYMDAVRVNLGEKQTWICGLLQYLSMYGTAIAYVITTAISMRSILRANCFHKEGHEGPCEYSDSIYMVMFGVIQLLCSLIPDFHNMAWLSVIAAVMSFSYSSIGSALGFAKTIGNGKIKGDIVGTPAKTTIQRVWNVSQAIGDIAFAFPYSMILLEIQDTLRSPPAENKTMKKASVISVLLTTFFYLSCGCFGYSAFGNDTPGNILTGFYEPFWLIDFANACVIIHLIGGYQVFSQPIFAFADRWSACRFPDNQFVNRWYKVRTPFSSSPYSTTLFRLSFRTVYVVSTTALALYFPYFNQVLGILGALNFWPLAIFFPVEMYLVQKKIPAWTNKWVVLRIFSLVCFVVSTFAFVGSVQGVIREKMH